MLSRRQFIGSSGAIAFTATAGCLKGNKYDRVDSLPQPVLGDESAPVTVKLFEDYTCPSCKSWNAEVKPKLIDEFVTSGDAYIEFYDYPIPVNPTWAMPSAMAARAVQDEAGDEAFWKFHKGVFDNQDNLAYDVYRDLANALDLDGDLVVDKTQDGVYKPVVEQNKQGGERIGIPGTPGIVVNGTVMDESRSYGAVARTIEQELR